jgi:SWI/SNF-related matrix-associated actin-dependent regulator 1 of chromatin subfamily A
LISLDDIKGHSAISLLEGYSGINPYLRKLKHEYLKNKKILLTETQSKYIVENHDREPIMINRVIGITKYLGEELQKQDNVAFIPEKILIEFILAETDKSYHVYGKLKQNQVESRMYWLPKTQVLEDPYFKPINVEVDFTKYNDILAKDGKKLYKHQEEGIKFLLSRNGCILGDDMGVAKTMQGIEAAIESGAQKILIVCPSALKINWERAINVFCSNTIIIDSKKWSQAKFTIINFDILKNFHTLTDGSPNQVLNRDLVNANFDLVIIDEAHYLKNHKSIRGEIMVDLCVNHNIPRVWLLTGTPLNNAPMDFYNLLKIIKSPIADNWMYYAKRYCDAKKFFKTLKSGVKRQIWVTNGASNLEELSVKIKNVILRRLKSEVLELPDKIITPIYHRLTNKDLTKYNELWEKYLEKRILEGKKNGNLQKDLVELIILRQFIANQAIQYTIELVENALDMGRKVIIFTSFTEELETLAAHFGKLAVKHNGSMTTAQKQKSVDGFQNNPKIKVFIGNTKSAGVGITLTESTVTVFNSYDWVPSINEQCEDRSYRIGQVNDVNIYYQLFENTISTRMWETLKIKKDIINIILGDKKINSEEEIMSIMIEQLIAECD